MKNIFISLGLIILITSCNSESNLEINLEKTTNVQKETKTKLGAENNSLASD